MSNPVVVRTPAAEEDLAEIADYIAVDQARPATAETFLVDIAAACQSYAMSPLIGAAAPELGEHYRIFHHKRWVVIYRPIAKGIEVLRVVDGARDYPTLFGNPSAG